MGQTESSYRKLGRNIRTNKADIKSLLCFQVLDYCGPGSTVNFNFKSMKETFSLEATLRMSYYGRTPVQSIDDF